jgi:ABC-type nitrate/sulfonate/bicarbonate transport system substrate-binding protein
VQGALLHLDFALEAERDPNVRFLGTLAEMLPEYPFELLLVRKDLIDRNPEAVTRITAAIIDACRYIATNKQGTLEVYEKYTGTRDRQLSERAYDALVKMGGFGVNGGMTREKLTTAMNMAVENKFLEKPVPLEAWADFRFQDEALRRVGDFKK